MRATLLNCTLKPSPEDSNTQALGAHVSAALREHGVEVEEIRVVDHDVKPGVSTDMGGGDAWPAIHDRLLGSEILVMASPTWLGQPSSVAKRVLERMDGMISETAGDGMPVAYNRVAGVVVTGNEDGAHHVISEIAGALIDVGYTIPGQAWTYWNRGPGPGPSWADTQEGHDWSISTGRTMAANLVSVATALQRNPLRSSS
jgi:multimeric flavodoxin WrbA